MIKYFAPLPLQGEKAIRSRGAKGVKCDRIQGGGYPPLSDRCGGGVGNTLSLRLSAAAPPPFTSGFFWGFFNPPPYQHQGPTSVAFERTPRFKIQDSRFKIQDHFIISSEKIRCAISTYNHYSISNHRKLHCKIFF